MPKLGRTKGFDRKVKSLILKGNSIASVSKLLGCSWGKVNSALCRLEGVGEIKRIPGTRSPVVFEDGCLDNPKYTLASPENENSASTTHPTTRGAGTMDTNGGLIPQSDDMDKKGGILPRKGSENPCPGKLVGAHISGTYTMRIVKAGSMPETIRDINGYTIGWWDREPVKWGAIYYWRGSIRYEGDDIHFKAHQNGKGEFTTFCVTPQRRPVYYKTCTIVGPQEMEKQVALVRQILMDLGWEFDKSALSGVMHYGDINPSLLQYARPTMQNDFKGNPVHADCSHGNPEVEVYGDSPTAQEDIDLLNELPYRIKALEDGLTRLMAVSEKLLEMNNQILMITECQSQSILGLSETVSSVPSGPLTDYMDAYR